MNFLSSSYYRFAGVQKLDRYQSGKQTKDLRALEGQSFTTSHTETRTGPAKPASRPVGSRGARGAEAAPQNFGASGADDAW